MQSEIVKRLYQRMSDVVQIPVTNFEQFQITKYEPGSDQQFPTHHDYNMPDRVFPCRTRILTCFLYMSDVIEGGETTFVDLDDISKS